MTYAEQIRKSHDAEWEKQACRSAIRILLNHRDPMGKDLAEEFYEIYGEEV